MEYILADDFHVGLVFHEVYCFNLLPQVKDEAYVVSTATSYHPGIYYGGYLG